MQTLVDTLAVVAMATAATGVVFGLGWPMLRSVRARGVGTSIAVVLACTLTSVVTGALLASWQMFLSPHDLRVSLIILAVAALVSGAAAWRMAAGMRAEAVWADGLVARESQMNRSREQLVGFVVGDLSDPLDRLRALAAQSGDDPASARAVRRQLAAETDRMSGLVDDLTELTRSHAEEDVASTPEAAAERVEGGPALQHESIPETSATADVDPGVTRTT